MEDSKTARSSKVIVVDKNARLLLIRRSATDVIRPGSWEFAGGEIEDDESPLQAAARETYEETGLYIPTDRLIEVPGNPRRKKSESLDHYHERYFYVGYLLVPQPDTILSHEHDYSIWLKAEDVLNENIMVDDQVVRIGHPEQKLAFEDVNDSGMLDIVA